MTTLPSFYVDNVHVFQTKTQTVRGNTVSDCVGAVVTGIHITNCDTLRAKGNTVVRMRSLTGDSTCFEIDNVRDALLIYHISSRSGRACYFHDITTLVAYNATTHNCSLHYRLNSVSSTEMYNAALTAYEDNINYLTAVGFLVDAASALTIDYFDTFGIGTFNTGPGTVIIGSNSYIDKPLYFDELNDDLTPDHISILVNTGTPNPLRIALTDIGGAESQVQNEATADRTYHQKLMDNTFWDVDNDETAEVSYIKAFQSRILANTELATTTAVNDFHIKWMESALGFSELWPTQTYYHNKTKFHKRVNDLWFAVNNGATVQALQNAIGGYNRYPSFFKRLEDISDCWVLGQSAIGVDNTLLGYEGLKYGILIDVLGVSTISQAMSGDCYNNTMNTVADVAPIKWGLNEYPQPVYYMLFADMWNNFEQCVLTNMVYNDDFGISPDLPNINCECITPMILTGVTPLSGISTIGPAPSGGGLVEISLLDRMYSESLTRQLYYRQGNSAVDIVADPWTEIINTIGGYFLLDKTYVQFFIAVQNVLRVYDYEFVALALRPWAQTRTGWPVMPIPYVPPPPPPPVGGPMFMGGMSVYKYENDILTVIPDDSGVVKESYDVCVFSESDMWTVGYYNDMNYLRLLHYDGAIWWEFLPETNGVLLSASGTASNDVWFGGINFSGALLYHWNGITIEDFSTLPDVGASIISNVLAFSSDNAYFCGYSSPS